MDYIFLTRTLPLLFFGALFICGVVVFLWYEIQIRRGKIETPSPPIKDGIDLRHFPDAEAAESYLRQKKFRELTGKDKKG